MWRVLSILVITFLVLLTMAIVLGFAMGVGWLMTLFLPFTLFEASLLAIIASVVTGSFWYNFMGSLLGLNGEPLDTDEEFFDEQADYEEIPPNRFFKSGVNKTWEAWLRYHLANSIYIEFQQSPQPVAPIGPKQMQELSIRLADLSIDLLKNKTARAKRLRVTSTALKKQMSKIGQHPYDDHILNLAAMAVNGELSYHHDELLPVVRTKQWQRPYDGFELKGE